MATLKVTPFARLGKESRGLLQASELPAGGPTQDITIGATSAVTTNPLPDGTTHVMLVCDAICAVTAGPGTPVATAADVPLLANIPYFFAVDTGQAKAMKIAAITRT